MSTRILVIQNFPDTSRRMDAIAAALKGEQEALDLVSLDFRLGANAFGNPLSIGLAQYLMNHSNSLRLALLDSPQALLAASSYLQKLSPNLPTIVNLRTGPLLEFLGNAPSLADPIRCSMNSVSTVLLSTPLEDNYLAQFGLPRELCCIVATPITNRRSRIEILPKSVSLVGDFSHTPTLTKFNLLLELLRSNPLLELQIFCEGHQSCLTNLPALPEESAPLVRIFLSASKEHDNFSILESLAQGTAVIASDGAAFGLGLSHLKEYLAANHPRTILQSLVRLCRDESTLKNLIVAGKRFVESNHNTAHFLEGIANLRKHLISRQRAQTPLFAEVR